MAPHSRSSAPANKLDGDNMTPATAGSVTTTKRDLLLFAVSQFAPSAIGSPTPGTWTALQPISGFVRQRE